MKKKNLLKLLGAVVLAAVITMAFVPGCAKEAPAPAPTPVPEKVHWKLSSFGSADGSPSQAIKLFGRMMEEKFDWFDCTYYFGGELLSSRAVLEGVGAGIADMAPIVIAYETGRLPLSYGLYLPGFVTPRVDQNMLVAYELYLNYQPLIDEYDRANVVVGTPGVGTDVFDFMGTEPIRHAADLKGMKVRAVSMLGELLKKLGSTVVFIPPAEIYTALDTGLVGSVCQSGAGSHYRWGWYEVAKYYTIKMPTCMGPSPSVINKQSWEALPQEGRDYIRSEEMTFALAKLNQDLYRGEIYEEALDAFRTAGVEIIEFPESEYPIIEAAAVKVRDEWIVRTAKDLGIGEDTIQAYLDEVNKVIKEIVAKYPEGV